MSQFLLYSRLFLCCFVLILSRTLCAQDDYRPPITVPLIENESASALAERVLPENATLLRPAIRIDFGADKDGVLIAMSIAGESRSYAIWYLAPRVYTSEYQVIRVKDPEIADSFYDMQIKDILTMGPEGARDLVLLETHSRSAAAGGDRHITGSVYRRIGAGAEKLSVVSSALDTVESKAAAKQALKPHIAEIPKQKPGSLGYFFLNAPVDYIDATKRERWQLLGPDSDRILVRDLFNGYVKIAGDAGNPGYTMALFKRADGTAVFALQTDFLQGQNTVFLREKNKKWVDVSEDLVPEFDRKKNYRLPQLGTKLEVLNDEGRVVEKLSWNRNAFTKMDAVD